MKLAQTERRKKCNQFIGVRVMTVPWVVLPLVRTGGSEWGPSAGLEGTASEQRWSVLRVWEM